jgi:hypothetical protein
VTRLDEFLLNEWLFALGPHFLATFSTLRLALIVTNVFCYILGDFFTNSSGRPVRWNRASHCEKFEFLEYVDTQLKT